MIKKGLKGGFMKIVLIVTLVFLIEFICLNIYVRVKAKDLTGKDVNK